MSGRYKGIKNIHCLSLLIQYITLFYAERIRGNVVKQQIFKLPSNQPLTDLRLTSSYTSSLNFLHTEQNPHMASSYKSRSGTYFSACNSLVFTIRSCVWSLAACIGKPRERHQSEPIRTNRRPLTPLEHKHTTTQNGA